MEDRVALLAKVSIFKGLDLPTLAKLSGSLRDLVCSKDSTIVGQNDRGDALYIIDSGRVKVVLFGDKTARPRNDIPDGEPTTNERQSNREMILSIFRHGDFFGEMSLLDGQPRSATVVALEDSRLLMLSREDFVAHLSASPSTALNILAEMSLRLRRADEIIGNLALLDVYGRLAHVLIDLAKREGKLTDEGFLIRERPLQQDVAAMIGTTRETVSRALSELQRRGFIAMQGKSLLVSQSLVDQPVQFADRPPPPSPQLG